MAHRGRTKMHTDEQIMQAILGLGIDTFSVPALARQLGVRAHSGLYRYFPDREAMVQAALSHAVLSFRWPSAEQPWDELLCTIGESTWTVCDTHRGFDRVALDHEWPELVDDLFARYHRELHTQGFTRDDAKIAVDLVIDIALVGHVGPPATVGGDRGRYEHQLAIVLDGLAQTSIIDQIET